VVALPPTVTQNRSSHQNAQTRSGDTRITATSTFGAVAIKGLPAPGDLASLLIALYADADVREQLERSIEASRAMEDAGGTVGDCDGVREGRELDAAQAEADENLVALREILAELEPSLPPVALSRDQAIALRSILVGLRLGQGAAELSRGGLRSK
jgi:hypothetical protein